MRIIPRTIHSLAAAYISRLPSKEEALFEYPLQANGIECAAQHFGQICPGALIMLDPVYTSLYPVCSLSLQVKSTTTSFSCFGVEVQFCHFVLVMRRWQPQAISTPFPEDRDS